MSDLPTTADNATPILIPSEITLQTPDTPDLSNPYMYPANQAVTNEGKDDVLYTENLNATFSSSTSPNGDPELAKLKSSFWKKAGQVQSSIGALAGLKSWEETGRKTEEEASREYRDAESRLNNGEPSRLHGEYDRLMGYLSYAVGHVAGDKEMQERAAARTEHGTSEIDRINKT